MASENLMCKTMWGTESRRYVLVSFKDWYGKERECDGINLDGPEADGVKASGDAKGGESKAI